MCCDLDFEKVHLAVVLRAEWSGARVETGRSVRKTLYIQRAGNGDVAQQWRRRERGSDATTEFPV